jgi:hypothetical protein
MREREEHKVGRDKKGVVVTKCKDLASYKTPIKSEN